MEHAKLTNLIGLATALRLPREWLRAEADAGRLPHLKAGRRRLFNVDAVRRALAETAARMPEPVGGCGKGHDHD